MKLIKTVALLSCLAWANAFPAQAEVPVELQGVDLTPSLVTVLSQAVISHNRARDGAQDVAKDVVSDLEDVPEGEGRNHPLLLVYLGSAYTLMGRDARSPLNAIRYTNRGVRIMDEAVDMAPRNFNVRIVRALNNSRLPAMFNRQESAIKDMRELVGIFEDRPVEARKPAMALIFDALIQNAQDNNDTKSVKMWQAKVIEHSISE